MTVVKALIAFGSPALVLFACGSETGGTGGPGVGGGANAGGVAGNGSAATGGGSGGNAGNTVVFGGTAGDMGTGGSLTADSACATAVYQGEEVPLDMYVLFDKSGSMSAEAQPGLTVWDAVKGAFITFVQSPESDGIGMGLQFFPKVSGNSCGTPPPCPPGCMPFVFICVPNVGGDCNVNDYLPPAVTIQPLPPVAPQIVAALNAESPSGGTPTLPAMQSARQATTAYAAANPGRRVIIVLATDGNPNDCNSTIAGVAAEAAGAFASVPSVLTFAIGIGNIMGLDQVAQAGGTDKALEVNPATAGQDFLDAMIEIRGKALKCSFVVDATSPEGDPVNFGQVNVYLTPPGGSPELIPNVPNAAACDPVNGGWYYDDPVNPQRIETCPATCDRIKVEQGTVEIQLGCDTVIVPR